MKRRYFIPLFFLFSFSCSFASTLYIGNQDTLILRENPSPDANVVIELPKNTPVELLKTNLTNGYSYVKTEKGDQGWVSTNLLVPEVDTSSTKPSFWSALKFWNKSATFKPLAVMSVMNNKSQNDEQDSIPQMQAQLNELQTKVAVLEQCPSHWKLFFFGVIAAFFCILIGYLWGVSRARRQKRWFA